MTLLYSITWTCNNLLSAGPSGSNCDVIRLKIKSLSPKKLYLKCHLLHVDHFVTALKEKETQHSFAGLLNIYISVIWLWYMLALFINRVKQNRCLKSENPQPMVVTILPPCSGKQMWMWCSVVSSPAWWLITPSLCLTHWGRVTDTCVSKSTIIGSDNGSSLGRRQAIVWANAAIL